MRDIWNLLAVRAEYKSAASRTAFIHAVFSKKKADGLQRLSWPIIARLFGGDSEINFVRFSRGDDISRNENSHFDVYNSGL